MMHSLRIITPTLGKSPFLEETIKSVENYADTAEHILIAPASECNGLRQRYPRVKVIEEPERCRNLYDAVNCGFVGDFNWFTYLNDDDLLDYQFPLFFEFAQREPEKIHYGKVDLIDFQSSHLSLITHCRFPAALGGILASGRSPFNQQGTLFPSELLRRVGIFDASYKYAGDLEYISRCHAVGVNFCYYPLHVARFRCHSAQLSTHSDVFDQEIANIRDNYFSKISWLKKMTALSLFWISNSLVYMGRLWKEQPVTGVNIMKTK